MSDLSDFLRRAFTHDDLAKMHSEAIKREDEYKREIYELRYKLNKKQREEAKKIKKLLDDKQAEGYKITARGNERVSNTEIAAYLSERCIVCDCEIPEGRQVCLRCEMDLEK